MGNLVLSPLRDQYNYLFINLGSTTSGHTDHEPECDGIKAKEMVLTHQIKQLEKVVQSCDQEIHRLQTLLGERVVSNISDPTIRLIYLEEYSRNLEKVPVLMISLKQRCSVTGNYQFPPLQI